jgi:hypothetical protein
MPVQTYGEIEEVHGDEEERNEDDSLQEAASTCALSKIAEFGGDTEAEEQEDGGDTYKVGDKVECVSSAIVGDGFFVAVLGKCVLLGCSGLRRGGLGLRQARHGCLRRSRRIRGGLCSNRCGSRRRVRSDRERTDQEETGKGELGDREKQLALAESPHVEISLQPQAITGREYAFGSKYAQLLHSRLRRTGLKEGCCADAMADWHGI